MTTPDMAKAMEYAREFVDPNHADTRAQIVVLMRASGHSALADALEEAVAVSRAFIAQGAELAHLRQTVESIKELRGYEFRIEWKPNGTTGEPLGQSIEYIRRSDLLTRLTGAKGEM